MYVVKNQINALYKNYVHTAAHLFGWIAKVFIIRDVKLCWIWSLLFELLEITFRHWLPIFNECWWDHFILDIFGWNMLGIIAGSFILKKLSMNTLDWIYAKQITDEKNQNYQYSAISRAFSIFKPKHVMNLKSINITKSTWINWNFLIVCILIPERSYIHWVNHYLLIIS